MAAPWCSSRIQTKILREDMKIAADTDPRRKVSAARLRKGTAKLAEIIEKMRRLVKSAVDRAYVNYAHASDHAMSREDLESEVNAGLVYGIHRYDPNGKFDPYNYLNGVIHVVLVNAHVRRNRMKRIPRNRLVSIDAPRNVTYSNAQNDNQLYVENLIAEKKDDWEESKAIDRIEVEHLFSSLEGKIVSVRGKLICLIDVVRSLMDGGNVLNVSRRYGISRNTLKSIIKKNILPILGDR